MTSIIRKYYYTRRNYYVKYFKKTVKGIDLIPIDDVLLEEIVMFYIANEYISLIENAGRLGVPIPKKLLDVLEQLKKEDR